MNSLSVKWQLDVNYHTHTSTMTSVMSLKIKQSTLQSKTYHRITVITTKIMMLLPCHLFTIVIITMIIPEKVKSYKMRRVAILAIINKVLSMSFTSVDPM